MNVQLVRLGGMPYARIRIVSLVFGLLLVFVVAAFVLGGVPMWLELYNLAVTASVHSPAPLAGFLFRVAYWIHSNFLPGYYSVP